MYTLVLFIILFNIVLIHLYIYIYIYTYLHLSIINNIIIFKNKYRLINIPIGNNDTYNYTYNYTYYNTIITSLIMLYSGYLII